MMALAVPDHRVFVFLVATCRNLGTTAGVVAGAHRSAETTNTLKLADLRKGPILPEFILVLLFLGFVLAVVTVVGHGIWVLLSAIFSRRSSSSDAMLPDDVSRLPEFENRPPVGTTALDGLLRQLDSFAMRGVINEETRQRLAAAVDEEERRLAAEAATPAAAAAAPPATAAPSVASPAAEADDSVVLTPIEATQISPPPFDRQEEGAHDAPAARKPAEPPMTPGERARKYAASRAAAARDVVQPPVATASAAPAPPPEPAVPMSRLFAAFMEENNIRWGELVGGLLIVGCSVALVISLWSQIAGRPLLQFVLFNGVTAALFGVGVYTDRRWKIHTTSRGVLVIATLLVPLNFLALAAFTQESPPTDLLPMAGEVISLAVFAFLVYVAGRILMPRDAVLLVVGVMVPCLMQLVIRRFAGPGMSIAALYGLAGASIAAYLMSACAAIGKQWAISHSAKVVSAAKVGNEAPAEPVVPEGAQAGAGREESQSFDAADGSRVLMFLGMVSAAVIMPLALLLYFAPPMRITLHWLSPLVAVLGLPSLVMGLLFWRRLKDKAHSGLQTAGIGVGVLGALVMAAAIVLAWPDPATLVPTALLTAAAMLGVALWFGIPAAHVPAALAIAAAAVVGFYVVRGDVGWIAADGLALRAAILSGTTGYVLLPLAAAFAFIAWWLRRTDRAESSFMYGLVTAAVTITSLGLALWFGFARDGDPQNIVWLLFIYAIGALAAGVVLGRADAAAAGSAILLAALVQLIVFRYDSVWQLEQSRIVALLAHAIVIVVVCGAIVLSARRFVGMSSALAAAKFGDVVLALRWSALVTSIAGAVWLLAVSSGTTATAMALLVAWVAAIWTLLAVLCNWPALFTLSQIAAVRAVLYAVTAGVASREWYAESTRPTLHPWFLQLVGLALAGYCLAFIAIRWFVAQAGSDADETAVENQSPTWVRLPRRFLDTPWPAVDQVVEFAVVLLVVLLATYAAAPGVALELSPTEVAGQRVVPPVDRFEIPGVPHAHAGDRWGWMLLAAAAVTLCAGLWQQERVRWHVIGLAILAMAMCPMLAFQWESDVAVASALRWTTAGLFVVASIVLWFMQRFLATGNAISHSAESNGALADLATMPVWRLVRDLFVAFIVLVYVVMAVYVGSAALLRPDVPIAVQSVWPWVMGWALLAAAAALFVPNMVVETRRVDGDEHDPDDSNAWAWHARNVMLILAAAPVAVLFTFSVAQILDRYPIVGPEPGAWFRRIGYDVSYGVPLAAIALAFIGHAVRDRSSGFAFAAGALLNVVATMVVLVRLAVGGGTLDASSWILVGQVNAIVAGLVALLWQVAVAWGRRDTQRPEQATPADASLSTARQQAERGRRWPGLLITQVVMAAALCAAFLLPSVVDLLFTFPPSAWAVAADGWLGWLAVLLASIAGFITHGRRTVSQNAVALLLAAVAALVALTAARNDTGNWLAYHTLLAGFCIAAWILPLATLASNRLIATGQSGADAHRLQWSGVAARCFGVAAVLLALRAYWSDPASPWWTIGGLGAIAARNLWIAWRERSRGSMWIAAALAVPAVSILWLDWGSQFSPATGVATASEFLWIIVLAIALLALFSVWIEPRRIESQLTDSRDPGTTDKWSWSPARTAWLRANQRVNPRGFAFHRFAAWAIVAVLLLTTTAGLLADYFGQPLDASPLLAWAACIAGAATALACLWDPAVRWPVACLYCIGLVAVGVYLDGLNLRAPLFEWALANALAAYSLATSALWSVRGRLSRSFRHWGTSNETADSEPSPGLATPALRAVSTQPSDAGHAWLVPANILLGVFVLLLVVAVELTVPSFTQRMVAAYAIGAQAFAIGLLAHGGVRTPLQYLALTWGVFFAIAFGWSFLPPDFPEPLLHRLVVTVAAIAVMVVAYGFGLVKFLRRENEWTRAAAKLVPPLAVGTVAIILTVLALEVTTFIERGQTQLAMPAIILIGAALVVLILAALAAALLPGRDPLGLSERGRTAYVYAAEALGGLLFLHIRVTMPWLFSGWFTQFWPLVVMAIAFVGVGLGEVFQRRRERVLAEPLHTTGVLLPLLPAIGFWVVSSQVNYSLLLLSIGVLYAAMSMLRRSFMYGVLAAVAANGSLWYLFHEREGVSFFDHPQLWLIPPALSALIAGYINRDRLTAQQSAALRYACAIVIYVSSTADIFINGVASAPWLPAVLAALSILGVLAGIWLRVRAFLYLGTAFLVVAILTIIWHAAINQHRPYILFASGIVTGALILALFGLFEKRRDDVLRMVEELKHWQA